MTPTEDFLLTALCGAMRVVSRSAPKATHTHPPLSGLGYGDSRMKKDLKKGLLRVYFTVFFLLQVSEWTVDYNVPGGTDKEGWQYAADFPMYVTPRGVVSS